MIRIYVFIDGQTGNQTNTNAQSAWWSLRDHHNAEFIYIVDAANPDNRQFIDQFKVTQFPTIVFVELYGETGKIITRIVGNSSETQITEVYRRVLDGAFGTGEAGSERIIIPGDDEDLSIGPGLSLLGKDVGKWLMFLLAGWGVYEFTKRKR